MKRSSMAFFEWGSKHGTFVGVVGGGTVGLIVLALYIQSDRDRDKMKNMIESDRDKMKNRIESDRDKMKNRIEQLHRDHENYKELARAELEAKLQQTRAEVAQQFLLFGYSEEYKEYKAYREKLKQKKDD